MMIPENYCEIILADCNNQHFEPVKGNRGNKEQEHLYDTEITT